MIKKLTPWFLNLVICFSIQSQAVNNRFNLTGTITGLKKHDKVELVYMALKNGKWYKIIDSTVVRNQRFTFRGEINGTTAAYLYLPNRTSATIYIEPSNMKLQINSHDPYSYKLSGTKCESENLKLRKELIGLQREKFKKVLPFYDLTDRIQFIKDDSERDSVINIARKEMADIERINYMMDSVEYDFARIHKSSPISPSLLYTLSFYGNSFSLEAIQQAYDSLDADVKTNQMGQLASKEIERRSSSLVGRSVADFTRISSLGDTIRLSDFRIKNYVLLEFWASWCIPCLNELPTVKKIYQKYKTEGLVIISMSSDENRNDWLKSIQKNDLNEWPQVLSKLDKQQQDKSFFNQNDLCNIFDINMIPSYLLIDKQGIIVGRFGHIAEEEVEKLIKK